MDNTKKSDLDFENVWRTILDLFQKKGNKLYMIGESITQIEHALQTFHYLKNEGRDETLQVAGLLHDIGHFLYDIPPIDPITTKIDDQHEMLGYSWLKENGFPISVYDPIRLHVPAKRYMCSRDKTYKNKLSVASVASLELQGGFMDEEEMKAFEREHYYQHSIELRKGDDEGKIITLNVDSISTYQKELGSLYCIVKRVWGSN